MDPLSEAASISALVSAIDQTRLAVTLLVQVMSVVYPDAQDDLTTELRQELETLRQTLDLLVKDASRPSKPSLPEFLIVQVRPIISGCDRAVGQLRRVIESHSGTVDPTQWTASESKEEVNTILEVLRAHRGALRIALETISVILERSIKTDTTVLQECTAGFRPSDNERIISRIQELQTQIQHVRDKESPADVLQRYLDDLSSYAETVYDDPLDRDDAKSKIISGDNSPHRDPRNVHDSTADLVERYLDGLLPYIETTSNEARGEEGLKNASRDHSPHRNPPLLEAEKLPLSDFMAHGPGDRGGYEVPGFPISPLLLPSKTKSDSVADESNAPPTKLSSTAPSREDPNTPYEPNTVDVDEPTPVHEVVGSQSSPQPQDLTGAATNGRLRRLSQDEQSSPDSSDNDSIFSLAASSVSQTSVNTISRTMDNALIAEFVNLLYGDEALLSLTAEAIRDVAIGRTRLRNNFRRLLHHCAKDIKAEVEKPEHTELAAFIRRYAGRISYGFFSRITNPEEARLAANDQRKLELFLREHRRDAEVDDSDDNGDGIEIEGDENEEYDGSLRELLRIREFLLKSTAFQLLRQNFYAFVHPSRTSELQNWLSSWQKLGSKRAHHDKLYGLSNLISELQDVPAPQISIAEYDDPPTRRVADVMNIAKNNIEDWTGAKWDWWFLQPCKRPLREKEARVSWQCACGDERWAEVPVEFANRLRLAIHRHPDPQDGPSSSTPAAPRQIGHGARPAQGPGNHGEITPPGNFSTANSSSPRKCTPVSQSFEGGMTISTATSTPPPTPVLPSYHILLVVKSGREYRLSQIDVSVLTSTQFFRKLRSSYFQLRVFLRTYFSAWRYSHCDFYMCEKFGDHEFTPRRKDAFPDTSNPDYEYTPKPMIRIPPVSEHEIYKRFQGCRRQPGSLYIPPFPCKPRRPAGPQGRDTLSLLPKKKSELEEGGDARELFWGIYARESISLKWVVLYNVACMVPVLVFFIVWLLPLGMALDLQGAAVPLSVMVGMLSVFWCVFFGSLPFRGVH